MDRCAWCGQGLDRRAPKYRVRIEVFAEPACPDLDEADLRRDLEAELRHLSSRLAALDPEEAQDGVHREFRYTLCRPCQVRYLRDPLHRVTPDGGAD